MALLAPALRLTCQTCGTFIDPGQPYLVQPDVAGVGPDRIACFGCAPDIWGDAPVCNECGDIFDVGERPYHSYCADDDDEEEGDAT